MYLNHYTKVDTLIKILENKSLRLSKFYTTNDPLETLSWRFRLKDMDSREKRTMYTSTAYRIFENCISDYVRERCKFICFNYDDPKTIKIDNAELSNVLNGKYKPRMWAQYGDDHKGVCITVDENKFLDNLSHTLDATYEMDSKHIEYISAQDKSHREDEYQIDYNDIKDISKSKNIKEDYKEIYEEIGHEILFNKKYRIAYFFRKQEDWRSENEYRIIVINENKIDKEIFVPINKDVVVSLTFGYKIFDYINQSGFRCEELFDLKEKCLDLTSNLEKVRWTNGIGEDDLSFKVKMDEHK